MKIILQKSQWELIGKIAGWIKSAQSPPINDILKYYEKIAQYGKLPNYRDLEDMLKMMEPYKNNNLIIGMLYKKVKEKFNHKISCIKLEHDRKQIITKMWYKYDCWTNDNIQDRFEAVDQYDFVTIDDLIFLETKMIDADAHQYIDVSFGVNFQPHTLNVIGQPDVAYDELKTFEE